MTEPVATLLGIKISTVVAGFAGGVVSLAFVQKLNRWQAVCAVVVGCLTATYLNPVIDAKLSVTQPEFVNCTAFVVGLCGMNIIPAIKTIVNIFTQQAEARFQPTQGDGGANEHR